MVKAVKIELNKIIKKYMEKHKLNQNGMAKKLRITPAALSYWLNPNSNGISRRNLAKVKSVCADVLMEIDTSIDDNFSGGSLPPENSIISDYRKKLIAAFINSGMEEVSLKQALQIVNNIMRGVAFVIKGNELKKKIAAS